MLYLNNIYTVYLNFCIHAERRSELGAATDVEEEWKQIRLVLRVPANLHRKKIGSLATGSELADSPLNANLPDTSQSAQTGNGIP